MQRSKHTLVLVGLVGLVVALFTQLTARGGGVLLAPPSSVATVDLEEVFRNLNQRREADARLVEMASGMDTQTKTMRDEIDMLSQDLEMFPPGSEQFDRTNQDLAKKSYALQAYLDFAVRKLDAEKSRVLHDIYEEIKDIAKEIAGEEGYDVVLVDDSIVEVPRDGGEAETMRQISARRMLYTNPSISITQKVIERMNR